MCFRIHQNHQEAKIAEKDIRCFKRMLNYGKDLISPFQGFRYESKVLYKTTLRSNSLYINEGLHSYTNLKKTKRKLSQFGSKQEIICEFIIPKGSEYYYNPDNKEYVSNQITWTGKTYKKFLWTGWFSKFK